MLILSGGLIVVYELEGKGMYRYETPDLLHHVFHDPNPRLYYYYLVQDPFSLKLYWIFDLMRIFDEEWIVLNVEALFRACPSR